MIGKMFPVAKKCAHFITELNLLKIDWEANSNPVFLRVCELPADLRMKDYCRVQNL